MSSDHPESHRKEYDLNKEINNKIAQTEEHHNDHGDHRRKRQDHFHKLERLRQGQIALKNNNKLTLQEIRPFPNLAVNIQESKNNVRSVQKVRELPKIGGARLFQTIQLKDCGVN
jgi:hypothetical protein